MVASAAPALGKSILRGEPGSSDSLRSFLVRHEIPIFEHGSVERYKRWKVRQAAKLFRSTGFRVRRWEFITWGLKVCWEMAWKVSAFLAVATLGIFCIVLCVTAGSLIFEGLRHIEKLGPWVFVLFYWHVCMLLVIDRLNYLYPRTLGPWSAEKRQNLRAKAAQYPKIRWRTTSLVEALAEVHVPQAVCLLADRIRSGLGSDIDDFRIEVEFTEPVETVSPDGSKWDYEPDPAAYLVSGDSKFCFAVWNEKGYEPVSIWLS